jgi:CNT family concentrative nucleoside transporter
MIRPYLEKMTRSEILCIMVGGMANTAGSVLAAYVGFLGGSDPAQQNYFALHMLSQSIMSAPAAIVCSKLLFPETDHHLISKELTIPKEKLGDNFLDALSLGTTDGLKLAVNVGAMLIVFTAMMWVVNAADDIRLCICSRCLAYRGGRQRYDLHRSVARRKNNTQ